MIRYKIFLGLFLFVFISCKTNKTSMLISDNYDESKNQTTLMLFPYGNIVFPDKWTKTDFNQSSKQHIFTNNNSTTLAIAKNPKEKYPFFKTELTDKEFVADFVQWDSEYWRNQGITVSIINDQSDNGYILWKATNEEKSINTIFLFGAKNDFGYNFSVASETWSEEKIKDFLIDLYINN
ncbi:MAG: hypothetical protein WCY89_12320 [Flavobacteriaceae bacterium]